MRKGRLIFILLTAVIYLIWVELWTYLPLSFDELIQYDLIYHSRILDILHYNVVNDFQFPLTYLVNFPLPKSFDANIFLFRFHSYIFSLGSLLLSIPVAGIFYEKLNIENISRKDFKFWYIIFFSFSHTVLSFNFSARPYSALIFFSLLSFYFLYTKSTTHREYKFIISLVFLSLTHAFGMLLSCLYILIYFTHRARQINSYKKVFFLIGFYSLCFFLFSFLYLKNISIDPLVERPLSFSKVGGLLLFLFCGPIVFCFYVLSILKPTYIHMKSVVCSKDKYRWSKGIQFFYIEILLLLLILFIVAIFLNLFKFPAFEYRYFSGASFIVSAFILKCLDRWNFRRVRYHFICLAFVLTTLYDFYFGFNAENRINLFPRVDYVRSAIHPSSKIVSCGNCPSFYFSSDQLKCLQRWDFQYGDIELKKADYLMVFDLNARFCHKYIQPLDVKILTFPGVSLYEIVR